MDAIFENGDETKDCEGIDSDGEPDCTLLIEETAVEDNEAVSDSEFVIDRLENAVVVGKALVSIEPEKGVPLIASDPESVAKSIPERVAAEGTELDPWGKLVDAD